MTVTEPEDQTASAANVALNREACARYAPQYEEIWVARRCRVE